jgi:hypothetical protein
LIVNFLGIYTQAEPESLPSFIQVLDVELSRIVKNGSGYNCIARKCLEKQLNKDAILSKFLDNIPQLIR